VISFYGFKGGVGRTTALAAFALYAAEQLSKNVVAVDLDLEAPGIGSLLLGEEESPGDSEDPRGIALDLGVVDFLLEQRIGRPNPLPLSRFYVGSPHVTGTGSIRVVPAGRLNHRYLEKLGRVDVRGLVEPGEPVRKPLLDLLKRLRNELAPDVILLDVRAGLHDLGGVSLSGLSHLELLFAVHSPQTWAGLPIVLKHLGRLRADWVKLVHAMVPPESRGGKDLHEQFVTKAYNVLSKDYYKLDEIPGPTDEDAAHWAYRLPFREALMAISSLSASRSSLLSDEHRLFCEQLAKDSGLEE
jgi:cellulose biosynthesis protein BcsQ